MDDIFDLGIRELQDLYRVKEISPEEVVNQHIERIEKVNPKLNAVCERNFESARKIAREQTENFSQISEKPLFGTPFSVKEMVAVEGFKLTAGSIHRRDHVSTQTATVVQRCMDAGAIPMVTTNVPEVGFWWETHNPIYGRTNNPYDISRTCGGSSGGEAAIISARGTFFGIGSDIGGSIRNPAGFCGIVGHKPTNRMIPLTGHFMQDGPEFADQEGDKYPYVTLGPLARKATDMPLLLDIMSGPDGIDPEVKSKAKLKPLLTNLSKLKVYTLDAPVYHLTSPTSDEVSQAVRTTADLFEQFGAKVQPLAPRTLKNAVDYWFACLQSSESRAIFEEVLTKGGKLDLAKQMLNRVLGKEDYTLPSLIFVMLERLELLRGREGQLFQQAMEMKGYFQRILGEDGILILPSMPYVAPHHRKAMLSPFDFIYCGIFNAFQFPATVMPIKLNESGLPVSIQIVAAPWQDHLCLSAAAIIEKTFGTLKMS